MANKNLLVTRSLTSIQCLGRGIDTSIEHVPPATGDVASSDECVLNRELVQEEFSWWYRKQASGDIARERLEREARKSSSTDLKPVPGQP
jgi:hypothetical protein